MYLVLNPLRGVRLYYQYLHMYKTLKLTYFQSLSVHSLQMRCHPKQTYLQHKKEKNYIRITGNICYSIIYNNYILIPRNACDLIITK